jgi:hypothetical protein
MLSRGRGCRRAKPSKRLRAAALLAWVIPVAAVTSASVKRGRMVDAPRPALLRPAAALQAALTLRALLVHTNPDPPHHATTAPWSRSRPPQPQQDGGDHPQERGLQQRFALGDCEALHTRRSQHVDRVVQCSGHARAVENALSHKQKEFTRER